MTPEERASHVLRSIQEAREEERRACAEICDRIAEELEKKILGLRGEPKFKEALNAVMAIRRWILARSSKHASPKSYSPSEGPGISDHRDAKTMP